MGLRSICIETAPFIYYVEQQPEYIDRIRAIMQRVSAEGLSVVASVMTLTETLTKPLKVGDQVLVQEYRALFRNTRQVRLIPITVQIADLAAQLRARYNLKTPDALQIATAIDARSDLFLTNDLGIKRVTDVRVLPLDELTLD